MNKKLVLITLLVVAAVNLAIVSDISMQTTVFEDGSFILTVKGCIPWMICR